MSYRNEAPRVLIVMSAVERDEVVGLLLGMKMRGASAWTLIAQSAMERMRDASTAGEDKSASVAAAIELVHTIRFVAGRDPTEDDESWLVDVHRRIARVSDQGLRAGDLARNGIDLQTAAAALRAGIMRVKEGT